MKNQFIFWFCLLCLLPKLHSQEGLNKVNDGDIICPSLGYGMNFPSGDLSDRYGSNLQLSLYAKHLLKNNYFYGVDFTFMFGNNVKEDVLQNFRSPEGFFLGSSGLGTEVNLRQRGLCLTGMVGKIIPMKKGDRSGVKLAAGAGVLQHNIRFLDNNNSVAQLGGDLRKGYDRMTRGFCLRQEVGYLLLSKNRRMNFEFSGIFFQGFTKEVRAYNFDTGLPTNPSRLDLGFGFQIAWILPFYINSKETIYY